ncbi:protein TOPLESS-RELATED PROTEIN 2 isoform X2 [Lactuca sativa]|uniref:protein TOPLESS-RELATED PROTEIN 2 isoform X2 n=1 Tax=Lactuca sativa TaxID=4236 RepID=UPI000CA8E856|nr:protein TOPLESS-RELATED PROTEIN 2 isoform X2 [Lactuca sativa]
MSHIREFEHLKITLEAIKSATNNFCLENWIGRGGFGNVYKGEIVHSKGQSMVAFKRLDRAFGQGNPEFWKEITMLSLYKHENLVHLLGFCDESDEKILVYDYASNRSLDFHLNSNALTWTQRLKICIGMARGLAYLHNSVVDTHVRVLHRDIKSSNILLDENWNAKISDFGLSKFAKASKFTFLFTSAVGTLGYCDPLYAETGFLTKESDVYSFGVVLFEVLCGRLCICKNDDRPLTGLARECYEQKKIHTIIYGYIRDEINHNSLRAFTTIAYRCLKRDREERPSMTDIVRMLETALEYQINKQSWELPDIVDSFHLKALRLPDSMDASKVMRLTYTNSGLSLLALASNGVHKLWKWQQSELNPSGKSTASIVPQLWQPTNGALMSNDVNESKSAEESAACIALSKNDSYVMSASGGKVSLFNMMTFKVMATFMRPPPTATYLAFHPQDNDIVAIGREDSIIQIYNARLDEVIIELRGHQKQITGLAFSRTLLVSSGADAQLFIWDLIGWEKKKSRSIQLPPGHSSSLVGKTTVQFHNDQLHLLVVHESQIAIYDHQLERLRLWSPRESLSAAISSAIYSCDGMLLYTGFSDGAVGVFDAETLRLRSRIAPSAFVSSSISRLEQESTFFFNMKYFEEQVQAGEWDEVEKYLCGFTKVEDNRYSLKIFFEIRKQKYLEALDRNDRAKAVEILVKDLKVFSTFNEELFKEITQLLTLDNFRQNEKLSDYGDTKSARSIMLVELKKLIEENPLLTEKLTLPVSIASQLLTLINQSYRRAYPAVIASHPSDPNQFALVMSDGSVHVIEPADADPKWGGSTSQDDNAALPLPLPSSNPSNSALNSQPLDKQGT